MADSDSAATLVPAEEDDGVTLPLPPLGVGSIGGLIGLGILHAILTPFVIVILPLRFNRRLSLGDQGICAAAYLPMSLATKLVLIPASKKPASERIPSRAGATVEKPSKMMQALLEYNKGRVTYERIALHSEDGAELGLHVTTPVGTDPSTTYALVLLHGGGFWSGEALDDMHRDFLRNLGGGVVLAAPEYRLSAPGQWHRYPTQINDAMVAIRYVASKFENVMIAGYSAGGTLAIHCALRSRDDEKIRNKIRHIFVGSPNTHVNEDLSHPTVEGSMSLTGLANSHPTALCDTAARDLWAPEGQRTAAPNPTDLRVPKQEGGYWFGDLPPMTVYRAVWDVSQKDGLDVHRRANEDGSKCDLIDYDATHATASLLWMNDLCTTVRRVAGLGGVGRAPMSWIYFRRWWREFFP